ncbi:MAG: TRAP transporter large permease [Gracilibacteraceae bacterium]|jgi:tripartite ATP-independent transporter DctM subunit|nr:TRAP transporter large permease [Gracilibacteraceae bacterium]
MATQTVALVIAVLFFCFLFLGMPIGTCMAFFGVIGFALLANPDAAFNLLSTDMFASFASYDMSTVVMFVWMGYIAFRSGVGSQLFEFAYRCIGYLPGGLAMAAEVACAAFGAVCGSAPATTATISAIAFPVMREKKYDRKLMTACTAAGGGLGLLIPPSTIAIIYGIETGCSIGKLFIAGIGAGILLLALYIITIAIMVKRNPSLAPAGERFTMKQKMEAAGGGLVDTLIIFVFCIGGLSIGWFTPTEGGAIGCFALLVVTTVRRKMNWKKFVASLTDTAETIGMILFILACAMVFGRFIAIAKIPAAISAWLIGLNTFPVVVIIIIMILLLIAGCFIDGIIMVALTVPIFCPIVEAVGYDLIWFGVMMTIAVTMGQVTPPVGMGCYIAHGVAPDVPLQTVFRGAVPFLLALIVCTALTIAFPQIIMFLPNLM